MHEPSEYLWVMFLLVVIGFGIVTAFMILVAGLVIGVKMLRKEKIEW